MTLTDAVTKKIIIKLIKGQDYRVEIVTLINATFLQYAIEYFKKIVDAKIKKSLCKTRQIESGSCPYFFLEVK